MNKSKKLSASSHPLLSRNAAFTNLIVYVDGITRSGKSLLGPVIASFDGVEIEHVEEIFEYVGLLHRWGKISHDAAIATLRLEADLFMYNSLIGRNSNFRLNDHSGVLNYPEPKIYYSRLTCPEGKAVLDRLDQEHLIFQNQTHDQLLNLSLHHEAFGDRFRMLEMIRHPIDLIDSWMRRGWGNRFGNDPLAFTYTFDFKGTELPWYSAGWEQDFLQASEYGRIVRMIDLLWGTGIQAFNNASLKARQAVFILKFDDITSNPLEITNELARFLHTVFSEQTNETLRRERCPRTLDYAQRDKLRESISTQLDEYACKAVDSLITSYSIISSGTHTVLPKYISPWNSKHK